MAQFNWLAMALVCGWAGANIAVGAERLSKDESKPVSPVPLLTIGEVRRLSGQEAGAGLPVRVKGVVTALAPGDRVGCFVQDGADAIFVVGKPEMRNAVQRGNRLEIHGKTGAGSFAPVIYARRLNVLGEAALPPPQPVSFAELASGAHDADWVEVTGVVRAVWHYPKHPTVRLTLAVDSGRLQAELVFPAPTNLNHLVDARVRLHAAATGKFSPNRQLVTPRLIAQGLEDLVVIAPPLERPFDQPATPADSLFSYRPGAEYGHRLKVVGVVTFHEPLKAVFIRSDRHPVQVISAQAERLRDGDFVEVLGFAGMGEHGPVLEDAIFRTVARMAPSQPMHVTGTQEILDGPYANELVTLEARLLGVSRTPQRTILVMRLDEQTFDAPLAFLAPGAHDLPLSPEASRMLEFRPGSLLRLTGVCQLRGQVGKGSISRAESFSLLLRSPGDVALIHAPGWWTPERLQQALLALALLLVAGGVWVWTLRRQVRSQASVLEARTWRMAVLEERQRIAREIHDTFAQCLASLSFQISGLGACLEKPNARLQERLEQASDTITQTHNEVRRVVQNMRLTPTAPRPLASALRDSLQRIFADAGARLHVDAPGSRGCLALPAEVETELLRITEEAIVNSLQHGQPRNVWMALHRENGGARLTIRDDGCGFNLDALTAEARLGLSGMEERARRVGGTFRLQSRPQDGTTLTITVPLESRTDDASRPSPKPSHENCQTFESNSRGPGG